MANIIKIKRRASGAAAGAPGSLASGELAMNEQDGVMYYGFGDNGSGAATSVVIVGGYGGFVTISTSQTITGAKTFSSVINGSISGNAATAAALQTARSITLGTDLGGTQNFDGSTNITINATIQNNAVTAAKIQNGAVTMPKLDITGGTSVTPANGDELPIYDVSNTANGKVSITNLSSLISSNVTSTFSASAGAGLSVTNSFTGLNYSFNIGALSTLTTPQANDYLLIYDTAASAYKKILKGDLVSGLGTGSVTSVALSAPSEFTVSGSPVTGAGTLTFSKASQTANTVWAAPNGSSGAPVFRLLVAADVPTLTAAKISDFDTQVRTSRLDQMAAPTASVSLNSYKIVNLLDPTSDQDAATKSYVDAMFAGQTNKGTARVATTGSLGLTSATSTSITKSGNLPTSIDGVTLSTGNVILVKDEAGAGATGAAANGLYLYAAGTTWNRATSADTSAEVMSGMFIFVSEGTNNADNGFTLVTDDPITLGTTQLQFTQTSGAGQIVAGAGMTKTGNTLDIVGTSNRITVSSDAIDIASTYAGQTSITTLGTIGTGTWQGTAVAVSYGGTGANSQSGARTNLGLGTIATQNANSVSITGGSISNLTTFDNNTIDGGTF